MADETPGKYASASNGSIPPSPEDLQEEPLSEGPPEMAFTIPKWLRYFAILVLAVGLIGSVLSFYHYFTSGEPKWEPSKINLVQLIMFCAVGLAVCALPWKRYQFRIRKIGPVEFDDILSTQAQERDEGLNELRQRVEAIAAAHADNGGKHKASREKKLARLIKGFLSSARKPYSSRAISHFMSGYSRDEIQIVLRAMVAREEIETRIGKRGHTLYRLAQKSSNPPPSA